MQCPQCGNPENPWFKPYCSDSCKKKGPPKPVAVSFTCRWCGVNKTFMSDKPEAKFRCCDLACYKRYDKNKCSAGTIMLKFLFKNNVHEISKFLSDRDLSRVAKTSKELTVGAIQGQLGPWYDHDAIHYDLKKGEVIVKKDRIIEIAVQSYRTATKLKSEGKPVILYRVSDRKYLNESEKNTQTVAGAVHNKEGDRRTVEL